MKSYLCTSETYMNFQIIPEDSKVSFSPEGLIKISSQDLVYNSNDYCRLLDSINEINKDISKHNKNKETYFVSIANKKIFFLVDHGLNNDLFNFPTIIISFSENFPSKKTFNKFLQIIKKLIKKSIELKLKIKIYSYMDEDFVKLDEIKEMSLLMKNEK
ncbi:MAG: hypothetical protein HN374_05550 [Cryomorphaceae bacterium]|jgi:hypothetical protein|nr:hypothetical protein [Cryomorphaceae bacterium]